MDNVGKIVFLVFMVLMKLGNVKHVWKIVYSVLILLIVANAIWALISQLNSLINVYYKKFWYMDK